jgi:hypothetical protein
MGLELFLIVREELFARVGGAVKGKLILEILKVLYVDLELVEVLLLQVIW